jgi:hypothetical protein
MGLNGGSVATDSDVLLNVGRLDVDGQSFAPLGLHKTEAAFDNITQIT